MEEKCLPITVFSICWYFRWYGTPRRFYKVERILNSNYNHGLKNFSKSVTFAPKNAFIKFYKLIKSKTGARFEPATHRLLDSPSTDWATRKVNNKTSHFHCLFRKEVRHIIKGVPLPLKCLSVLFTVTFESSPATDSPDQWPPLAGNLWTAGFFITCLVCWPTISPGFD